MLTILQLLLVFVKSFLWVLLMLQLQTLLLKLQLSVLLLVMFLVKLLSDCWRNVDAASFAEIAVSAVCVFVVVTDAQDVAPAAVAGVRVLLLLTNLR